MKFQTIISLLALSASVQAAPLLDLITGRDAVSTKNTAQCPDYCDGTQYNKTLQHVYVCGDFRLGPKRLPTRLTLGNELEIYDRFGGLCPGEFLTAWYNTSSLWWNYPVLDGFQLNTESTPIQGNITLPAGDLLDRFGSEYGTFMSPYGAPYMQRALPPSNLNTPANDDTWPFNYHVYKVEKPFVVLAGPITPWFGQPGHGVQYKLSSRVMDLISAGYLSSVALNH